MSLSTMARMAAVLVSGKLSQVSLCVCVCVCAINCEKEERGQILILSLYYFVSSSRNVLLDDVFRHPVQSIVVQHENPFSIALLLLLAAWHFALAAQVFRDAAQRREGQCPYTRKGQQLKLGSLVFIAAHPSLPVKLHSCTCPATEVPSCRVTRLHCSSVI